LTNDPFVDAVLRIAAQHYRYNPPVGWLQRIAPTLNQTPAGRTVLGSFSAGSPQLAALFRQYGFNNYPYPVGGF